MKETDERREVHNARQVMVAGCMVILLLGCYLAFPLKWLCDNGYISNETGDLIGRTVYAPVRWLVDRSPAFLEFINWLDSFWE
jgi:hypothetical protein